MKTKHQSARIPTGRLVPLLLLYSAAAAGAVTSVQTESFSFVPTNSQVLTFNKFDTALGTLQSITVTTHLTKSGGSLYVDNDSVTSASGTISQSVTINLATSLGSSALIDVNDNTIGSNVTATTSYFAHIDGDDGDTDTVIGVSDGFQSVGVDYDGTDFGSSSTSVTQTVQNMTKYQIAGAGTYTYTVSGLQYSDTTVLGGAAFSGTPATASGDVVITYHYAPTPIPETSSAALGGIGLLALLRRRRLA